GERPFRHGSEVPPYRSRQDREDGRPGRRDDMGRKAIVSGTVAVVLALAGAPAVADGYGRHGGVYAYAKVLSVQPNVRYVTVRTPVQECWEETRYYTVEHRPPGNPVGTLVGAVIGGV